MIFLSSGLKSRVTVSIFFSHFVYPESTESTSTKSFTSVSPFCFPFSHYCLGWALAINLCHCTWLPCLSDPLSPCIFGNRCKLSSSGFQGPVGLGWSSFSPWTTPLCFSEGGVKPCAPVTTRSSFGATRPVLPNAGASHLHRGFQNPLV